MNWVTVFLSARGRMSPEHFERAAGILDWVCYIPISFSFFWRPTPTTSAYSLGLHVVLLGFYVLAIWPWLAIAIKRLHDSEHTIVLAVPIALAMPLAVSLVIAHDLGASAAPAFVIAVALFAGHIWLASRLIKLPTVPGSNRFGPQPTG